MAKKYFYQDAIDLYNAIKPELNVTDEQFDMHIELIKEQGSTGTDENPGPSEDSIVGYTIESRTYGTYTTGDTTMQTIELSLNEAANFGTTHTLKVYFPEDLIKNTGKNYNYILAWYGMETSKQGPSIATDTNFEYKDNYFIASTNENVAIGAGFGKYLTFAMLPNFDLTESDLDRIKIIVE